MCGFYTEECIIVAMPPCQTNKTKWNAHIEPKTRSYGRFVCFKFLTEWIWITCYKNITNKQFEPVYQKKHIKNSTIPLRVCTKSFKWSRYILYLTQTELMVMESQLYMIKPNIQLGQCYNVEISKINKIKKILYSLDAVKFYYFASWKSIQHYDPLVFFHSFSLQSFMIRISYLFYSQMYIHPQPHAHINIFNLSLEHFVL